MGEKKVSQQPLGHVGRWFLAGLSAVALVPLALCCAVPSYGASRSKTTGTPRAHKKPKISGQAKDGRVLSVSDGTWWGAAPMAYSYQWEVCASLRRCSAIPGATAATYRVTTQEIKHTVRVLVTAANSEGSTTIASKGSKRIKEGSPINVEAPAIAGDITEGVKLMGSTGSWVGTAPFKWEYQWERCSLSGGGCVPIEKADEAGYTPVAADLTSRLAVVVTAANKAGKATALSLETLPIEAVLPTDVIPPSITGLLTEGEVLGLDPGHWEGTEPISLLYQWKLCNAAGEACTQIQSASGPTLKLLTGYVGDTVEAVVTANNPLGSTSATTAPTGLIAGIAPADIVPPSLLGGLLEGDEMKLNPGEWTSNLPVTYSYAWQLCNALGQSCSPIKGAASPTLTLLTSDIGDTLEGVVTAKNAAGEATATSSVTEVIKGILPANTSPPSLSGGLLEGDDLKLDPGKWSGTEPISLSYAWELCNALGQSCSPIKGAASPTLTLLTSDIGDTIEGVVTAKNVAGESTATSSLTELIKGIAPSSTAAPSLSGGLIEGDELQLSQGKWSGSEPITYSYAWELCNATGKSCNEIVGALGAALPLPTGYIGDTIEGVVTAKNVAGETTATSAVSELVKGIVPSNKTVPSISGGLIEGEELKASPGSWSGTEPISYVYQWQLCNSSGGSCKEISGATASTLKLLVGYIGDTINAVVTAKNVAGETSKTTAASGLVKGIAPANTAAPSILGSLLSGDLLTAEHGAWTGSLPITYSYQWQLCSLITKACSNIGGATGETLKLGLEDVGGALDVIVTAKNVAGEASKTSSLTGTILG